MRTIILILAIVFSKVLLAQSIDFQLLRLGELNFYSTKSQIISQLGEPDNIYEPNYECGFLSEEEQGRKYYTLEYLGLTWTGNDAEKYLLEKLDFSKDEKLKLNYDQDEISSHSSVSEISRIFGIDLTDEIKSNGNMATSILFLSVSHL